MGTPPPAADTITARMPEGVVLELLVFEWENTEPSRLGHQPGDEAAAAVTDDRLHELISFAIAKRRQRPHGGVGLLAVQLEAERILLLIPDELGRELFGLDA